MTQYQLDTMNYIANGTESQRLDNARKLARIETRLDIQYDTLAGASALHDGNPGLLIDDYKVGGKGFNVFEADGWDLYYIAWLLNKREPDMIPFDIGIANDKLARLTINIPLQIEPGQLRNVNLKIDWNQDADIGVNQTVDTATINGTFFQNDNPAKNLRVIPIAETDTTGRDSAFLDDAGRLTGLLIITRANATPFGLRDFIDDLSVRINGVYPIVDTPWNALQSAFLEKTGNPGDYIDGVGYVDLSDEVYIPKEGSRIEWEGDNTSTDVIIYQIFEPVDSDTQEKAPTVTESKPTGARTNTGRVRPGNTGLERGVIKMGLGL